MAKKIYYKKASGRSYKKIVGFLFIVIGLLAFLYTFFPLISWKVYFAGALASQKIDAPIPLSDLLLNSGNLFGKNFYDARDWYPDLPKDINKKVSYSLSIPELNLNDVIVSNIDTDLTKHLVQFNSDSFPGTPGNVVIFGHSTLPQLFDEKDYKTIFSNLYKLKVGDKINIALDGKKYSYKITQAMVVEADNTTVLAQDFSSSSLTLITCTPPGTVWKRLVIKAKLV